MISQNIFYFIAICAVTLLPQCNAGSYTIVAGNTIRPFSELRVAVSREGGDSDASLLLEVGGKGLRESQQITVDPDSTSIVSFRIGALEPGQYNLLAKTITDNSFSSSTPVIYNNKTYCVFVHTDKTVYTPGDVLMFRLLVLNKHLKPILNQRPQVALKDSNGNIIDQWTNIPLTKGVFSGEVKIAEFPALGDWYFEVDFQGQSYKKKVLVVDYVLPKFNLQINAPKHIYYADGVFETTVTAEQFSGKPVNGELTLSAYPVFYSGIIQPIFQTPVRKVIPISGKAKVSLSIGPELGLGASETGEVRLVVVEASVEETLTGRRHNNSILINLHGYNRALSHVAPKFYKPELPYTLQIKVSQWEDKKPSDFGSATVRYYFEGEKGSRTVEEIVPLGLSGKAQYTFVPQPQNNQSMMTIEIRHMDLKEKITNILPSYSSSDNFIQPFLMTPNPSVGEDVRIKINCTQPLKSYSYYVLGRGEIVYAKTLRVVPARKIDEFKFQASQALAPEATIIVSYVGDNGQLISSSLVFSVSGVLQNHLNIKVVPDIPESLGNLDISVVASPDSYVALMANAPSPDFSIATDHHYNAGEGDGLSMMKVINELRMFSNVKKPLADSFEEIGGAFTSETFKKAGVVLLTNHVVNKKHPRLSDNDVSENLIHEDSTRPPLAGPYAFSHLPAPPAPRLHLGRLPTPTWLFANLTLGGEGKGLLGRRVSGEAGDEWAVGGWSMHPTKGLGLAQPVMVKPRMKLLKATIPRNLRQGEILALPVTIKNPYINTMTAEVTLHNTQNEFVFEDVSNEINDTPKLELYKRLKFNIPSDQSATKYFFISVPVSTYSPKIITIRITATGRGLSETFEQEVTVFPDGEEESMYVTQLLDLRGGNAKANLTIQRKGHPSGRVLLSKYSNEEIEASVAGSLLTPALQQMPKLLEIPPASGYHNMIPFMASLLIIQSLASTGQSSAAVTSRGIEIMQQVYQQQLAYRQSDGSFSVQSQQNQPGSVWVTGNAARWLGRGLMVEQSGVQANVIKSALNWLMLRQQFDGHWREAADVVLDDNNQQNEITLTALVLQAFLDTKPLTLDMYSNVISKAEDWLARNIEPAERYGPQVLAPVAKVLFAAQHPAANQATNILTSVANSSDGRRWWDINKNEGRNPWRGGSKGGLAQWTASWGLESLLGQGLLQESIETASSLFNALGGWTDITQSMMSLPSIVELIKKTPNRARATIDFNCPSPNDKTLFSVNDQNSLFVQKQQVKERRCEVVANGQGMALAMLNVLKRTNVTRAWPRFTLDPRVDAVSTTHHLQLTTCIGFVTTSNEEKSGPVLMDLRLPTGYEPDLDLPALLAGGEVRSAKILTSDSQGASVRLILSPFDARERCITLRSSRIHTVVNEKPGVIKLTDLSDSSRRARVFFSSGFKNLCEICSGEDCGNSCEGAQRQRSLPPEDSLNISLLRNSANVHISSLFLVIIPLAVFQLIPFNVWR